MNLPLLDKTPQSLSSTEFHQTLQLVADSKKNLVVDKKSGSIKEANLLRSLWENIKGAFGFKQWNDHRLIEFKVLDLLTHGVNSINLSDIRTINLIAERFGLGDQTGTGGAKDHSELNQVIQKLRDRVTVPGTEGEEYEIEEQEILFYEKFRNKFERYDISKPTHLFSQKVLQQVPPSKPQEEAPHDDVTPQVDDTPLTMSMSVEEEVALPAIYPQDVFAFLSETLPAELLGTRNERVLVDAAFKKLMGKEFDKEDADAVDIWVKERILEIALGVENEDENDVKRLLDPKELVSNLGLSNTAALLCRGYQLAVRFSSIGDTVVRKKSVQAANLFKDALSVIFAEKSADITMHSLSFRKGDSTIAFNERLKQSDEKSKRWEKITQIFTGVLYLAGGLSLAASAVMKLSTPVTPLLQETGISPLRIASSPVRIAGSMEYMRANHTFAPLMLPKPALDDSTALVALDQTPMMYIQKHTTNPMESVIPEAISIEFHELQVGETNSSELPGEVSLDPATLGSVLVEAGIPVDLTGYRGIENSSAAISDPAEFQSPDEPLAAGYIMAGDEDDVKVGTVSGNDEWLADDAVANDAVAKEMDVDDGVTPSLGTTAATIVGVVVPFILGLAAIFRRYQPEPTVRQQSPNVTVYENGKFSSAAHDRISADLNPLFNKPADESAHERDKRISVKELQVVVRDLNLAAVQIVGQQKLEAFKAQIKADVNAGKIGITHTVIRKKYEEFFKLNEKDYDNLNSDEKKQLERGFGMIFKEAFVQQEINRLQRKLHDENPYRDETTVLKRFGYLALSPEAEKNLEALITKEMTENNITSSNPLNEEALKTKISEAITVQTAVIQEELVSAYCNNHEAEINALVTLMSGEGIPPDAIAVLKTQIQDIKLEARLKALKIPEDKREEMRVMIATMQNLRRAFDKKAEEFLKDEAFSVEGLVKKGITPDTAQNLFEETREFLIGAIDARMKAVIRSLKNSSIFPKPGVSVQQFTERLLKSTGMISRLKDFETNGKVSKSVQDQVSNSVIFYGKWQKKLKYDFSQMRTDLGTCLSAGVCMALSTRWALDDQRHPDRNDLAAIGAPSSRVGVTQSEISGFDRFHQAMHHHAGSGSALENRLKKYGVTRADVREGRMNRQVIKMMQETVPLVRIPEAIQKKLSIKEAKMIFTMSMPNNTRFTNLSEILQTYLNDSDVSIELKKSHGTLLFCLSFLDEGGHATYLRFDPSKNQYHFGDPNFGLLDFDDQPEFFDFLKDLTNLYYDKISSFDLIQLESQKLPPPK